MNEPAQYAISIISGESLKGTLTTEQIIDLDRQNMESTLKSAGLEFPENRRRVNLLHTSNRIVMAEVTGQVVGYVDYCDDTSDTRDMYLSSIQIKEQYRGGALFRLLVAHLVQDLKSKSFRTLRTQIQISNLKMIAIAKKAGFRVVENPANSATLTLFLDKSVLDSLKMRRLFGLK